MQKTWIKICGITQAQDAAVAAELGADAIGVVLYPASPRAIETAAIPGIVSGLPERITVVALFVDPDPAIVRSALAGGGIDLLQFHGSESAAFCEQFGVPYMKAVAVRSDSDLEAVLAPYESAQYFLLDSYDPILPGGTGKTFDWGRLQDLNEKLRSRLVLAGGLTPDNVKAAIALVSPFGVDVSSGVEASKGIKDHGKMKSFIEGVRTSG